MIVVRRYDEEDLVPRQDRCPSCHERRVDYLVWIDDENVQCGSCDRLYQPARDDDRDERRDREL